MSQEADSARLALARRVNDASALTRRRAKAAHVLNVGKYRWPAAAGLAGLVLAVSILDVAGGWLVKTSRGPHERSLHLSTTASGEPFDRRHITHTVRDGDTLWKLAQYYYGSGSAAAIKRLRNANPELPQDPRQLKIGLRLKIPFV